MKKLCVMMIKNKIYNVYRFQALNQESNDKRFSSLGKLFSDKFKPGNLINWLYDETKSSRTNEWISIRKERGAIALYDISACFGDDDYYPSINSMLDPEKRFVMSIKNFAEILVQWEQLRVSMPDIILIVIHEDNHVSLETNPAVIKEYQDAGYAFDSKDSK